MVFAKKTNQAFMTDDQKARLLGNDYLGSSRVQTTPHLFGWLFYIGRLSDTDKDIITRTYKNGKAFREISRGDVS